MVSATSLTVFSAFLPNTLVKRPTCPYIEMCRSVPLVDLQGVSIQYIAETFTPTLNDKFCIQVLNLWHKTFCNVHADYGIHLFGTHTLFAPERFIWKRLSRKICFDSWKQDFCSSDLPKLWADTEPVWPGGCWTLVRMILQEERGDISVCEVVCVRDSEWQREHDHRGSKAVCVCGVKWLRQADMAEGPHTSCLAAHARLFFLFPFLPFSSPLLISFPLFFPFFLFLLCLFLPLPPHTFLPFCLPLLLTPSLSYFTIRPSLSASMLRGKGCHCTIVLNHWAAATSYIWRLGPLSYSLFPLLDSQTYTHIKNTQYYIGLGSTYTPCLLL